MDRNFRRKNHYVPEFLLKQFSLANQKSHLWEYRLLVSDPQVPEWDLRPASRLARTSDLYTITEEAEESDRIERWLDEAFEAPARDAVVAATSGERLQKGQWRLLIRLYAAQLLRTPAFYIRHKDRWAAEMEQTILKAREALLPQLPKCRDIDSDTFVLKGPERFPLRYTIRRHEGLRRSIQIEYVTGRKHWMWAIEHGLRPAGVIASLEKYKWSIVIAPPGLPWFLTDNPATCTNAQSSGILGSSGGWKTVGSKLLLPLSPKYLLYHHVGSEMKDRYFTAHPLLAKQLRCHLADSALRSFYSDSPDDELALYRPRAVNPDRWQEEARQWSSFGEENSRAERFEPTEA